MSTDIKTFIFLDLETTGLPHLENNKTKITELCLVAVNSEHIRLGVFPRVQNKLSFCFNPWKLISAESEKITGLSNFLLEHLPSFSSQTVDSINSFISHNPKPVCFVAHNGNRFDYPILRKEILNTGTNITKDVVCIDSLTAFRAISLKNNTKNTTENATKSTKPVPVEFCDGLDELLCKAVDEYEDTQKRALEVQKLNETTPMKQIVKRTLDIEPPNKKIKKPACVQRLDYGHSFRLVDVYERLTGSAPVQSHMAEGDVNMLVMCAATLGDEFVDWANHNTTKFCDIPPMEPCKRLGK